MSGCPRQHRRNKISNYYLTLFQYKFTILSNLQNLNLRYTNSFISNLIVYYADSNAVCIKQQ